MIKVSNLVFQYTDDSPIFDGFTLQINAGESWAVIGPSGCGKSTLLYLIAGLLRPSSGVIAVGGSSVQRPRPETGLILQDHGLLPWATIRQNVDLGLRIRKFYGPDGKHVPRDFEHLSVTSTTEHWLTRLGIADLARKYPGQISGGQRQRTAIARTLAMNPDLLLMDEPFSALDAPTREDLQNVVIKLQQETGLATVLVTHNIEEAVILGAKILVLGPPPNSQARVVENLCVARSGFRHSSVFQEQANHLRHLMGLAR